MTGSGAIVACAGQNLNRRSQLDGQSFALGVELSGRRSWGVWKA